MWIQNKNNGKWELKKDTLSKDFYNSIRQDLEDITFYSKCLDGISYLPINNLEDIYDILKYKNNDTWYINSLYSISGSGDKVIDNNSIYNEYYKFKTEYGLTLKNLFTPSKVINDSLKNFINVDVCTTEEIEFINNEKPGLVIDNIRIKENHRILVKDQITSVTLNNSVNPDSYFDGNYYITNIDTNTTTYYYYNEENGIYRYTKNRLVRELDLDNYDKSNRYSIYVKLGDINYQKQYHLSRLKSGYYPLSSLNQPIEFLEKHNWVLRNNIEYQNILDIDIYDSIKTSSNIIGSYSIPERSLYVGDFGSIFVYQDNYLNLLKNKYKFNFRSIKETIGYYWVVGDKGSLIRIDKKDLSIKYINIDTLNKFNSIDFFKNQRGVIVGDLNEIWYTFDGGDKWIKIEIPEFNNFNYNKVIFYSLNDIIIGGDNGTLIYLKYNGNKWIHNKNKPIKIKDEFDEFELVDNIRDIVKVNFDSINPWNLTYSSFTSSNINVNKDLFFFVGSNNLMFLSDNNSFSKYDYIYLSTTQSIGDIKAVEYKDNNFYIISDKHYSFDINSFSAIGLTSNIVSGTLSLVNNNEYNNIYNWNDYELQLVGDNLTIESYTFSSNNIVDKVSNNFLNKLKSKLLFLDYDIGSKLNFYGDDLTYRLPNNINFTVGLTGGSFSQIEFKSISNENSWLDYHKDKLKQFKYNTSLITSNEVKYNTIFSWTTQSNILNLYGSQSTNLFSDIENLLSFSSSTSSTYSLFMYDNLSILKTNLDVSVGDLILMDSEIVKGKFIANRVENIGGDQYIYMYTHFNENITNSLVGSTSSISFKNLNRCNSLKELSDNFNEHYIGYSYNLESGPTYSSVTYSICSDISVNPIYNEKNAYYNIQLEVSDNTFSNSYTMLYENLFLNFGYHARYNILDYLNNINPIFNSSKEFYSMPIYNSIPVNNSNIVISDNKISFNSNLKFEWETFWISTFIDVEIFGSTNELNEKLFILNKYYDTDSDRYIIELHKSINQPTSPSLINISSRRTLLEISNDLNEINNIQTNIKKSTAGNFDKFGKELNFKFNTDSYVKILLSDKDIKNNLTGIVYTDYKNELSLNIIDIGEILEIDISNIVNYSSNAMVITNINHNLTLGDYILITSDDKTYDGYHIVTNVISNTQFTIDSLYINNITNGKIIKNIFDPYLNYIPSDIIDIGADGKGKISVEIKSDNVLENKDKSFSLINLDLSNYKFNLIDGLYIGLVSEKYPWILESEITNALIGEDQNGIVWYSGIWHCGRWFNGTWYSGKWYNGEWYNGTWNSNSVDITKISGKVNKNVNNKENSVWYNGNFHNGTWNNGIWYNGRYINGTWNNGDWFNGQWDNGIHNNGVFMGGTWINGTWNNGLFNSTNSLSTWINGTWNNGDFESGIWKNGTFTQLDKNIKSRFGTKSFNSRKSIWESGKFSNGEFHSILREENNITTYSLNHKYTIWKTGQFNNGFWYGGTAYNISFKNSTWVDGVLGEIEILDFSNSINNGIIKVSGVFPFNRNDQFYIIDNIDNNLTYSLNGTNDNPINYLVKDIEYEIIDDVEVNTYIHIYKQLGATGSSNITSNIISRFESSEWNNGLWMNGLFDGDIFKSGLWLKGIFRNGEFL